MSLHKFEENGYDRSDHKEFRRGIIDDLLASCDSMTGTNYPTVDGAKALHHLREKYSDKVITLAEKGPFKKGAHPGIVKLRNTDVFTAIVTNPADLLDIDLYGGLPMYGKIAIERAEKWRYLALTCAAVYRNKPNIPGAVPKGQHLSTFIPEWAAINGWTWALRDQYKHKNKREEQGIPDGRGPWYYLYVIHRTVQ